MATSGDELATPAIHYLQQELSDRLAEDADLFRFLVDAGTDGFWYWNLEVPDDEWMSPSFWRCFGVDPSTKPHSPSAWQDLIHPVDRDIALLNFERHCADPDHPYDQVVRYRHADGSTVWVRCRGLALRDANGKPIRMLGTHNDVTQMKLAEQDLKVEVAERAATSSQLRLARDRLTQTLLGTGVTLWECTPDLKPVWTSPNFAEVNGFEPSNWGQFPHFDHFHPDDVAKLERFLDQQDALLSGDASGGSVEVDYRYLDRFGTYRTVNANVRLDVHGPGRVLRGHSIDVTEERRIRAALSDANDELLAANKYLEDFSYILSHDLRAPLRAINSASRLIRVDAPPELVPSIEEYLDLLEGKAELMNRLIEDTLHHARTTSESGDATTVEIGKLVDNAIEVVGPRDGIEVQASGDLETAVTVSDVPLSTCIRNLVGNAIKHHPGPAGRVEIIVEVGIEEVTIKVADDGAGIDPCYHDLIFEPFKGLDKDSSGLGLAAVRRIVDKVHGSLTLDSEPDAGSTFTLAWPLATPD